MKPKLTPPFGIRISEHLEAAGVNTDIIAQIRLQPSPPWLMAKPKVDISLSKMKKSGTDQLVYKQEFGRLRDKFKYCRSIFTDGSKDAGRVAWAAVIGCRELSGHLPGSSSIFTAEAKAILSALNYIKTCRMKSFVIYTDSLSCLQAITSGTSRHPLILKIIKLVDTLSKCQYDVTFCWLPSHTGIAGNEKADAAAKDALKGDISNIKIPYSDFKPSISKYIRDIFQSLWDEQTNNKLHEIKSSVGLSVLSSRKRYEQTILRRCRIGHSRLTHGYLLNGEDPPVCIPCDERLTIKHILMECIDFAPVRQQYYQMNSLKDIFCSTNERKLLDFLSAVGLSNKL